MNTRQAEEDAVEKETKLFVNGEEIPLNEFVNEMFANVVLGMIQSLKGVEDPKEIELRVELVDETV
ncbi:MAG TPA: hypothetical protein ENK07_02750 [Bacteroidetes bacterium]|nr:hypothetical protein [Bacteroidota bacterium]